MSQNLSRFWDIALVQRFRKGSLREGVAIYFRTSGYKHYHGERMIEPIERLSLGRYQGIIDYPEGYRLEEVEVIVDNDGNVTVMWLELPGKPFLISREDSDVGNTYRIAFEDGTLMQLREQMTWPGGTER
jgi:hypothetical protein